MNKNLMMCSATFNRFEVEFIKKIVGVPTGTWKHFMPVREYLTGDKQNPNIQYLEEPGLTELYRILTGQL